MPNSRGVRQRQHVRVDELEMEQEHDVEASALGTLAVQGMWQDALAREAVQGGFMSR